jgi:hypothetical protein
MPTTGLQSRPIALIHIRPSPSLIRVPLFSHLGTTCRLLLVHRDTAYTKFFHRSSDRSRDIFGTYDGELKLVLEARRTWWGSSTQWKRLG